MATPVGGLVQEKIDFYTVPNPPTDWVYVGIDLDTILKWKDSNGVVYSSQLTGTSSQILYFDDSGLVTSDSSFTRDGSYSVNGYLFGSIEVANIIGLNPFAGTCSLIALGDINTNEFATTGVQYDGGDRISAGIGHSYGGSTSSYFRTNKDGAFFKSRGSAEFLLPYYDGTPGQTITTDGSGNLTFSTIPPSGIQTVQVSVNSSQILNCYSLLVADNPIVLVPAPGTGSFIQYLGGYAFYTFVSASYSVDTYVSIQYNTNLQSVNDYNILGNLLSESVSSNATLAPTSTITSQITNKNHISRSPENTALILTGTSDPTIGDGTLNLYITYRIVTL